jgi:hypothetical protein
MGRVMNTIGIYTGKGIVILIIIITLGETTMKMIIPQIETKQMRIIIQQTVCRIAVGRIRYILKDIPPDNRQQ